MNAHGDDAQLLAIDLGTSACKVAIFDLRGKVVAEATEPYHLAHPEPLAAVQDVSHWHRAVFDALRAVSGLIAPGRLAAIGLSGQMGSAAVLDAMDQPLLPALTWLDQRPLATAQTIVSQLRRDPPSARVYVGALPLRLAWLRERFPEVYARAARAFAAKDLVGYWLTGRRGTDPASAQAPFAWSPDLLEVTGVSADLVPSVMQSTAVLGTLLPGVADATGLPAGVPVVVGAGDGICAALACGAVSLGAVCISLGTSSVARVVRSEPLRSPLPVASNALPYMENRWLGTLIVPGGAYLSWLAGLTGFEANRLADLAHAVVPGAGPVFLPPRPDAANELLGGASVSAGGSLVGLRVDHRAPELARAIVDGTVYGLVAALRRILPSNRETIPLRVTGRGAGEARSADDGAPELGALGTLAALWEGPVQRASGDATLGAAIVAALGAGLFTSWDEAVDAMVVDLRPVRRDPILASAHQREFARFERLFAE